MDHIHLKNMNIFLDIKKPKTSIFSNFHHSTPLHLSNFLLLCHPKLQESSLNKGQDITNSF